MTVSLVILSQHGTTLTNLLPTGDLLLVPDTRDIDNTSCLGTRESPLGDEKCARDTRALLIVLHHEVGRDVLCARPQACHGWEDDAMAEL